MPSGNTPFGPSWSWLRWLLLSLAVFTCTPAFAQSEQPAQPSEPTSTPTSDQLQLSGPTSRRLLRIFQTLDLRLGERETQIGKLEASQSTLSKALEATENSLGKASASLEQATKDNAAKDEAIADLTAQIARDAAEKRRAVAWWRAGAISAGAGLLGSAFGWKGAAIGAIAGALGGGAWALTTGP